MEAKKMTSRNRAGGVDPIYLDYQATTPTDPRVVEEMIPWFTTRFGNPHSADHEQGWDAAAAVEAARAEVAALIGATAGDIVFTSGATEANNMAIRGAAAARRARDGRDHVVTLATEHKCVLESVARLAREGFRTTVLPVRSDGLLDPAALQAAVDGRTALISVMTVNNEIGVIQPMAEIAEIAAACGALLHSDCAQAAGRIALNVNAPRVDLMSLSAHKLYGPKGVGALYLRRRPRAPMQPLLEGGGQERGLRPGTLSPALCVGFAAACRLAAREMETESARLRGLRDRLLARLRAALPELTINGDITRRIPGNLNISCDGLETADLLARLGGLAVSAGSACSSGGGAYSHVLRALGHAPGRRAASLRISPGRFTTEEEIDAAAAMLITAMRETQGG